MYPYQNNLDIIPKAAFDNLIGSAAYTCQPPIALVCPINDKRWWFNSQVGLDPTLMDSHLALCTEMLQQLDRWTFHLLRLQYASAEQRLATYRQVTSKGKVRFYSGTLLITPQELLPDILLALHCVHRELTLRQQEALLLLSRQALSITADYANGQWEVRQNLTNRHRIVDKPYLENRVLQTSPQELADIKLALEQYAVVSTGDHTRTINYANTQLCEISQESREQLLGANHRLIHAGYHSVDFFQKMWATITSGKVWKGEIRNSTKDGSVYWMDTTIVPILKDQGKPYKPMSICHDITPAKPGEEERVSKAINEGDRFFLLSPDLLCVVDLEGHFQRVNPAFEKSLSYTTEELLSKSFLDFVHPEDKAVTQAQLEKLATDPSNIQFKNRYRCQDRSYKWLEWNIFGFLEEGLLYAIARESTKSNPTKTTLKERTRLSTLEADVGTALRESGKLPESLKRCTEAMVQHLDAIGAGIWTVDPTAVGEQDVLALDLQASAGHLIPAETFPHHVPPNHDLIGAIAQSKHSESSQLSATSADSNLKTFFNGYPLIVESRLVGVIGLLSYQPLSEIMHGVLEWVANAIALAIDRSWAREELLSRREALLFRLASQIRNSLDLDTILSTAVTEIRTLLKVDCCYFLWCWSDPNQPSVSVTHEACDCDRPSILGEEPPLHLAPLTQAICNLQPLRIDDVAEIPDLDPQTRTILNHWGVTSGLVLPLQTQTGQLGAIVCSNYDKPRLWSDREVELLQAVVDQLAIAIEHAELFATTRAAALAAQTQARQLELALHDLQKTEARLIQTEKMSTLGQMVAGIAHEINNPVCFITGNLSHATNYIQDLLDLIERYQKHYSNLVPELQDHIEEIDLNFILQDLPKLLSSMKMGADRIHEIVISLRNFSRLDDTEMKPVNIHEGIDSTLLILHNRLKPIGHNPGIQIIKQYGNLPPVECFGGQLNQVFMNIISNAIDALETQPEPRNITICTEVVNKKTTNNDSPEDLLSETDGSVEGEAAIVRIRDNGPGMTQSVVNRLFDPFFTTKPVGKGTGLGLSISYQIVVEKHGGILKCLSEPGQGCEFWIQIPIGSKAASVKKQSS